MDKDCRPTQDKKALPEKDLQSRRDFFVGLKKWSKIVIGGVLLGGSLAYADKEAAGWAVAGRGGGWANRRGGGGWANRRGGGGWLNRRGGGGWLNGGGGWYNRGGSWINRW
jgi:hypothetical protein